GGWLDPERGAVRLAGQWLAMPCGLRAAARSGAPGGFGAHRAAALATELAGPGPGRGSLAAARRWPATRMGRSGVDAGSLGPRCRSPAGHGRRLAAYRVGTPTDHRHPARARRGRSDRSAAGRLAGAGAARADIARAIAQPGAGQRRVDAPGGLAIGGT